MKVITFVLLIFILQQAFAYDKFDVMVCETMANNSDKDNCLADLKGEYTGEGPTKQTEKAIAQKKTKSVKQTPLQKIDVSKLLESKSSSERASLFANLLHQSGKGCGKATRTFLQGYDKDGAAYWNVSCSNGQSYNVQVPANPSAIALR